MIVCNIFRVQRNRRIAIDEMFAQFWFYFLQNRLRTSTIHTGNKDVLHSVHILYPFVLYNGHFYIAIWDNSASKHPKKQLTISYALHTCITGWLITRKNQDKIMKKHVKVNFKKKNCNSKRANTLYESANRQVARCLSPFSFFIKLPPPFYLFPVSPI